VIGGRTATVLTVDDDPQLCLMLGYALQRHGFRVEAATSGEQALDMLHDLQPDVVLLDVLLPGLDGMETCRHIRARSSVPIIMLTVLGGDRDVRTGFEAGADDYCRKPVSIDELAARVRARLRRRELDAASGNGTPRVGESVVLDAAARQAIVDGRRVDLLSPREYALLDCLASNRAQVVTHRELIEHVWGTKSQDYRAHLRAYIRLLRRKIEPDPHHPRYIRSRARLGYVLDDSAPKADLDA
jgi:DNA-binding response OmpR family regulator